MNTPRPPIPYTAMTDEELLREARLSTDPLVKALTDVAETALDTATDLESGEASEVGRLERELEEMEESRDTAERLAEDRLSDITLLKEQLADLQEQYNALEKEVLSLRDQLGGLVPT